MECSLSQDMQECIQEAFQLFSGQNTAEEFTLRLLLWQRFYDEGGGRVEPLGRLTKFWLVSQPFLLCCSSTILNWAAQQCAFIEIEEWDQLCGVILFSTLWLIWTSLRFPKVLSVTLSPFHCIVCLISNQPALCEADAANKNPLTVTEPSCILSFFYQILKKSCQTKGKQVGLEIVTKRWEEENKGLGGSALRTIWERFRAIKGCKVFEEAPLLFQELSTCKSPKCATNPNVLWGNRRNQRELQTWEWLRCQF